MHLQALALRSYHFEKVGRKPELTLLWEPEDPEQEPVRQVSTSLVPCVPAHSHTLTHLLQPSLGTPMGRGW